MSSNVLQAIKNLRKNLHNVGSLNNWSKKVLNQGAVAKTDMDNFTLVKLGFNAKGEREAEQLAASSEKGYLVATPEDYMKEYETISSFFNAKDEMVRIVKLEEGVRFECSNYELEDADTNTNPLKNGALVHYDHTSKKFKISNKTSNGMSGYSAAGNQFIVVDANCVSIDGQSIVRFEVTK